MSRWKGDKTNKFKDFEDETERRERYLESLLLNQQRYYKRRLENLNKASNKWLNEIKGETLKMKLQMEEKDS